MTVLWLTGANRNSRRPALTPRMTTQTTCVKAYSQLSGPKMRNDAYTNSPVHRFFPDCGNSVDCNVDYATKDNPSGCLSDPLPLG